MKKLIADSRKLIPLHHFCTSENLLRLVRTPGWIQNHPIPVFPAPENLSHLGDYILNDGTKRTIAALTLGLESLPILVLESTEDISATIGEVSRPYARVFANVVDFAERIYSNDVNLYRLNEMRTEEFGRGRDFNYLGGEK